ncbi:hypothetical protein [Priestia abyssalis]|uniref:hypothetical protein n=1 Tax=Priestia abyssalis TaxID=1221450 RepID=UPI0009954B6C|nr:hypothetical protein [Priestia abyssalis]
MYYEMITSPCHGTIEKVSINQHSRVYEWEPLFYVKTIDGGTEIIKMGVSGEVQSLEVQEGDQVIPGMVLAYIKEEMVISASD